MVKVDQRKVGGKVRVDYLGLKGGSWYDLGNRDLAPKGSYVEKHQAKADQRDGQARNRRGMKGVVGRRGSNSQAQAKMGKGGLLHRGIGEESRQEEHAKRHKDTPEHKRPP